VSHPAMLVGAWATSVGSRTRKGCRNAAGTTWRCSGTPSPWNSEEGAPCGPAPMAPGFLAEPPAPGGRRGESRDGDAAGREGYRVPRSPWLPQGHVGSPLPLGGPPSARSPSPRARRRRGAGPAGCRAAQPDPSPTRPRRGHRGEPATETRPRTQRLEQRSPPQHPPVELPRRMGQAPRRGPPGHAPDSPGLTRERWLEGLSKLLRPSGWTLSGSPSSLREAMEGPC